MGDRLSSRGDPQARQLCYPAPDWMRADQTSVRRKAKLVNYVANVAQIEGFHSKPSARRSPICPPDCLLSESAGRRPIRRRTRRARLSSREDVAPCLHSWIKEHKRLADRSTSRRMEKRLLKVTRAEATHFEEEDLGGVVFAPLIGEHGWSEEHWPNPCAPACSSRIWNGSSG